MAFCLDTGLTIEFVNETGLRLKSSECEICIIENDFPALKKAIKFAVRKKPTEVLKKKLRISGDLICQFHLDSMKLVKNNGEYVSLKLDKLKRVCEFLSSKSWDGIRLKSDQILLQNLTKILEHLENCVTKSFLEGINAKDEFLLNETKRGALLLFAKNRKW